jgi:hypothetical protein
MIGFVRVLKLRKIMASTDQVCQSDYTSTAGYLLRGTSGVIPSLVDKKRSSPFFWNSIVDETQGDDTSISTITSYGLPSAGWVVPVCRPSIVVVVSL